MCICSSLACRKVGYVIFRRFEDFGHSKAARDMLKDYLIGTVHPDDVDKFGDNSKAKTDSGSSDNPSWIAAVIGILAVVVALYLKFGQSE